MTKSQKGSQFERNTCRQLSLWWTNGERDDVFWRSAGSGAMAKTRSKSGKGTFGQYGDVQATDPVGQPLLDAFTIELKRGYNRFTIQDLLDKSGKAQQQYEKFFEQVMQDAENAGTDNWLLIVKRDRRDALVFMNAVGLGLEIMAAVKQAGNYGYFNLKFYPPVFCSRWEDFLEGILPEDIRCK